MYKLSRCKSSVFFKNANIKTGKKTDVASHIQAMADTGIYYLCPF